jgi:hypothetical protein
VERKGQERKRKEEEEEEEEKDSDNDTRFKSPRYTFGRKCSNTSKCSKRYLLSWYDRRWYVFT